MYSNLFDFYQELGATARAKNDALTARATFITGVMEQGYRLWLTLLTTEVTEAVRAASELSACKTPSDVAEVQAAWFQASSARAITSLQGTVEIANFLMKNLQDSMIAGTPSLGAIVPPAPAPMAIAAPLPAPAALRAVPAAIEIAAPAPAPITIAPTMPAPTPVSAPVAVAIPSETAAPVALTVEAPAAVPTPIETQGTAPVVVAIPSEAVAPVALTVEAPAAVPTPVETQGAASIAPVVTATPAAPAVAHKPTTARPNRPGKGSKR